MAASVCTVSDRKIYRSTVSAPPFGPYAERPVLFLAGHLVLQGKRGDCGIASPVIDALCGQNANRQSEHERGDEDDDAFGPHGSPLGF